MVLGACREWAMRVATMMRWVTRTPAMFWALACVMALGLMLSAGIPSAQAVLDAESTGLSATAGQAGYGTQPVEITTVIGRIIAIGIGLLGLILFIFIVYGGIMWMTAQGDPAKVTKAQGMIVNAVIGMIIVMAAYAISNFVITQLSRPETGIIAP